MLQKNRTELMKPQGQGNCEAVKKLQADAKIYELI